jgi:hypothetical protein
MSSETSLNVAILLSLMYSAASKWRQFKHFLILGNRSAVQLSGVELDETKSCTSFSALCRDD